MSTFLLIYSLISIASRLGHRLQIGINIRLSEDKRVYYRVTIPFTRNPILVEDPYPFYDWVRLLSYEKVLYLKCNYD